MNNIIKVREDGSFRILHMADIQEGRHPKKDTVALMYAAIREAAPDLIVMTGDQLKGYSPSFQGRDSRQKVEQAIKELLAPIVAHSLPFAVTFGNHDCQCGLSNQELAAIYRELPGCICPEDAVEAGTFSISVMNNDNQEMMRVLLMDSGKNGKGRGVYTPPAPASVNWLKREVAGCQVPVILFQHIPLPEYKLCENVIVAEPICSPIENVGEFQIIKRSGNVFAVFCGHDHKNEFIGNVDGIDLGYTPSCGFACYGPGARRAYRLLEFHQEKVTAYETKLLRYCDLVAERTANPIREYLDAHVPTC